MRKWLVAVLLLGLMLGVLPSAAAPVTDLTNLAKYFPENTFVFGAMRTDDRYIQTLDSLLERVKGKFPPGTLPPISLKILLDLGSQQLTGKNFDVGIRSWLGDTAALGVTALHNTDIPGAPVKFILAMSITNRTAAETFVTNIYAANNSANYEKSTLGSFTVFSSKTAPGVIAIGDDAAFITLSVQDLPQGAVNPSLKDDSGFNETLGMLPNGDYDLVVYSKTGAILKQVMPATSTIPGLDPATLADIVGSQALGVTILDDRSLVVDVASNVGDPSALAKLGLNPQPTGSIDPAFAKFIPADSSLAVHATNFKALYGNVLQSLEWASKLNPQTPPNQMEQGLSQVKGLIQAVTGLDVDDDILSWMTSDYALFARVDFPTVLEAVIGGNGPTPQFATMPFGGGLVIKATDPAKAKAVASGLGTALTKLAAQSPNVKVSAETIGGTPVTVVSQPIPGSNLTLDVVMGANDHVFVLATRAQATAILTGAPGLDTNPAYIEASKYVLNNPTSVTTADSNGFFIISGLPVLALLGPAIGNIFDNIVADLNNPGSIPPTLTPDEQKKRQDAILEQQRQMVQMFKAVLSTFSSASISASSSDNGDSTTRLVITFAP